MRLSIVVASSVLALAAPAFVSADEPPEGRKAPVLRPDQFVRELGHANKAEVKLGQLARRRGDTEAVKDYGRHMIEDHTKAYDELVAVAKKKGFDVPSDPNEEQRRTYDQLDRLRAAEFDRQFAAVMVKDHEKVIALVEKFASDGEDPDLKAYAGTVLPTLKHHLEMAQALAKKVGT